MASQRRRRSKTAAADTEPIYPNAKYPRGCIPRITGISETRMRIARSSGIVLPVSEEVGRRKFVNGDDLLRYIEELGAHEAALRESDAYA